VDKNHVDRGGREGDNSRTLGENRHHGRELEQYINTTTTSTTTDVMKGN
jgi:hypothetical protein